MYCSKCGKEILDEAVICPHCGCAVASEEKKEVTETTKANVFCIIGFVLSLVSLLIALYGAVAIAGMVLSIIGVVQANKKGEKLKGLGIAGIVISAGSLVYTFMVLTFLADLIEIWGSMLY